MYVCMHACHACYMPRPSHPPRFDHLNNIWRGVQTELYTIKPCYNGILADVMASPFRKVSSLYIDIDS
jgi:hypothetical protein